MLSLNNVLNLQAQIILPLSHGASLVAGVRSSSTKPAAKHSQQRSKEAHNKAVACAESFNTVLSWLPKSCLMELTGLPTIEKLLKDLVLSGRASMHKRKAPWSVCYTSADSFFENKHGLSREQIRAGAPLLSHLFLSSQSSHVLSPLMRPLRLHQARGFKTKITKAGDTTSSLGIKAPDFNERFLGLRTKKDKDKQKLHAEAEQSEKLKVLLSDENLTAEEQQRLRIAFAEGYLACDPKARPNTKLRIFNIFRDLLGIILILAILFSFMGELSGTRTFLLISNTFHCCCIGCKFKKGFLQGNFS